MRARSMALGAHHFLDKSSEFDRVAELLDTLR
jgi:two-component system OmpR family response regulator